MSKKTDTEISAIMARFDAEMQSKQPLRRGGRVQLAPYAEQFRRYIEMGWTRTEILAEMKALGLSTAPPRSGTCSGSASVRKPKPFGNPVYPPAPPQQSTAAPSSVQPGDQQAQVEQWVEPLPIKAAWLQAIASVSRMIL